ncbi:MAG TPA: AraC family transcriptional regulator [Puia sp.]|nr:AraC family transcriptional regulator [Puia sp.]
MTYYQQVVQQMHRELYPNEDLTARVIQVKRYIERNYYLALSLDKMAGEVFLSKFHFIRIYRKYYGRTPYAYLKEVRLVRAKALLRNGMSIKDVCYGVGFESVPSFTRLYKEMIGVSPGKEQFRIRKSPGNCPSL